MTERTEEDVQERGRRGEPEEARGRARRATPEEAGEDRDAAVGPMSAEAPEPARKEDTPHRAPQEETEGAGEAERGEEAD